MKNRFGFTTVEIAIALVIIAVGFLPIYNLFRQGSAGTVNTVYETKATNYASDLINFCKDLKYYEIDDKVSGNEQSFANDTEIQDFFSNIGYIAPTTVDSPFNRKLVLTRFDRRSLTEFITDLFKKRKKVETFKVEVTVTFPRMNGKGQDEVSLYTLIMD